MKLNAYKIIEWNFALRVSVSSAYLAGLLPGFSSGSSGGVVPNLSGSFMWVSFALNRLPHRHFLWHDNVFKKRETKWWNSFSIISNYQWVMKLNVYKIIEWNFALKVGVSYMGLFGRAPLGSIFLSKEPFFNENRWAESVLDEPRQTPLKFHYLGKNAMKLAVLEEPQIVMWLLQNSSRSSGWAPSNTL
jgi:hypothetical protein